MTKPTLKTDPVAKVFQSNRDKLSVVRQFTKTSTFTKNLCRYHKLTLCLLGKTNHVPWFQRNMHVGMLEGHPSRKADLLPPHSTLESPDRLVRLDLPLLRRSQWVDMLPRLEGLRPPTEALHHHRYRWVYENSNFICNSLFMIILGFS